MSDIYFSSKTRKPLVHNGFESFLEKNNFCYNRKENSEKANRIQRKSLRRLLSMPRGFFYKKVFSVSIGRECVIKANRFQRSSVKRLFTMDWRGFRKKIIFCWYRKREKLTQIFKNLWALYLQWVEEILRKNNFLLV